MQHDGVMHPTNSAVPGGLVPRAGPTPFLDGERLIQATAAYLRDEDSAFVRDVLAYMRELSDLWITMPRPAIAKGDKPAEVKPERPAAARSAALPWDLDYVISVALTLAEAIHIDAVSLAAVLLYQAVESGLVTAVEVGERLGGAFGDEVAQTIEHIEHFDALQRPGAALRRNATASGDSSTASRERKRARDRQRQTDVENLRKMFVAMSEDPRVAVFKIADQLRLMRVVRQNADALRAQTAESAATVCETDGEMTAAQLVWTEEECRLAAEETREIYAPLAGRLGMGRVESELEDLAFAVLEPEDYCWLRDAIAEYIQERGAYVERVCAMLLREMRALGLEVEVSGRVKHLYSIYRKVQRTGSRDLTNLYDILAFRILVATVGDCYVALGHVHALWQPVDGRIKDFIANPKPNGYESLHTTVFCIDDRLAEIQIRTRAMHELAEYGVAMHWYYKSAGDAATAEAGALQGWVQQVREWQQELQSATSGRAAADRALEAVKGEVLKEQIFVFTPAGDVKEMAAGASPLDFAYLIHTDLGNHVAGVRVSSTDANGKLVRRLVPLDYELKNGDIVEIIKRKDAHPTRDWLHVARTKSARNRILRYLKEHERDIDMQIGRDRLDRELRALGMRKGVEDLTEDDWTWLVKLTEQADEDTLLAGVGAEKIRIANFTARLREHFRPAPLAEPINDETVATVVTASREPTANASVAGLAGMLTHMASCCDPLPGDSLMGFITRGRGVMIHRVDCPNLTHLLELQPERAVAVDWPHTFDGDATFRAPIVIEAIDRQGLLADVTGVITNLKINMLKVTTITKPAQHRATITATLEIHRPEQLTTVLKELRQVASVDAVERKRTVRSQSRGAAGKAKTESRHPRKT